MLNYEVIFSSQIRSIADVADEVHAGGDLESAHYLRAHLDEDIMQCMVDVLKVDDITGLDLLLLFEISLYRGSSPSKRLPHLDLTVQC